MRVEQVDITTLRPDPDNVRRHGKRNLEVLKNSLKQFGQTKPVVALEDGTIIAGSGTLTSALELGWDKLWVSWFDDPQKARAYAIMDNRSAELAEWDAQALALALEMDGVDKAALGFTEKEVEAIIKEADDAVTKATGRASFQGSMNYKLTYELVFSDHAKQQKFFDILRQLNKSGTGETVADRLLAHLEKNPVA